MITRRLFINSLFAQYIYGLTGAHKVIGKKTIALALSTSSAPEDRMSKTYCNPLNLPYRFELTLPSRREAADPTMVVFQGEYWLFASRSGGYWHSKDLLHWKLIEPRGYPVEEYAPTAVVMGGKIYVTASGSTAIYSTDDPAAGTWRKDAKLDFYADPDLYLDDDGKLYLYYGCSDSGPLGVAELDPGNAFQVLRKEALWISRDPKHRGWEVPGDNNELLGGSSWIEGSWMTKHKGRYYLQFSAPGTQYKSYADGVLVGDNPMGPFRYAEYSPFCFKPTGFIAGAGHGSTFMGLDGKWRNIATQTISVRDLFERRLGLFPVFFEPDGQMVADTYLGDYPHFMRGDGGLAGWMLQSYGKPVVASSTIPGHDPARAVDENIRTWWSASTGNPGEWLQVDMGGKRRIDAVQVNFADDGSVALGKLRDGYRYSIDASDDAHHWKTIVDRRGTALDTPDDYRELKVPAMARYVRITNAHMPAKARFSISGLRIFGNGLGAIPSAVKGIQVKRDPEDPRSARIEWHPARNAGFYIVRFGIEPDRKFKNYQVYKNSALTVRSLNAGVSYYFTVDAVNENGIAKGAKTVVLQ